MTVSDSLSGHLDYDLASQNKIIQISFQIRDLLNNLDKLDSITQAINNLNRLNAIC